jgi:hypothetical protein
MDGRMGLFIKEKKAAKSAALRKTTLGKNIPCK